MGRPRLAHLWLLQILLCTAEVDFGRQNDLFVKNSTTLGKGAKTNGGPFVYYRNGQPALYCKNVACPSVGNIFYTYSCCNDGTDRKDGACCIKLTTAAKLFVALSIVVALLIFSSAIALSLRIGKCRRKKNCNRARRKGSSGNPSLTNYRTNESVRAELSRLQAAAQMNDSIALDSTDTSELLSSFRVEADAGVMTSSKLSKSLTGPNSKHASLSTSLNEQKKPRVNVLEEKSIKEDSSVARRSEGALSQAVWRSSNVLSTQSKQEDLLKLCPTKRSRNQCNTGSWQPNSDQSASSLSLPPLENLLPVHESTHNTCIPIMRTLQTNRPSFLATGSMLTSEPSAENSGHKLNCTPEHHDYISGSLVDRTGSATDARSTNGNVPIDVSFNEISIGCSAGRSPNGSNASAAY
uniref:Uncharacterized protein n=1 Tax=Trichuris muris TaxID=70415 RepID=A0A5S6PZD2_TRIMR